MVGIVPKTALARVAPSETPASAIRFGWAHNVLTITKPLTKQITTVHQKGPVIATSA